jgi:hypothetical protein
MLKAVAWHWQAVSRLRGRAAPTAQFHRPCRKKKDFYKIDDRQQCF